MAENSLEQQTKQCTRCKEIKPVTDFYRNPQNKKGFRSRCKRCLCRPLERYIISRYCSTKEGHKICTKCGQLKPLAEFYPQPAKPLGVRSACIECIKMQTKRTNLEAVKRYQKSHRDQIRARRREYTKKRRAYNKQYDAIRHRAKREKKWAAMGATPRPDCCEICGIKQGEDRNRLKFDHCHNSGHFRGWLCNRCNLTLGKVEDKVDLLYRMIEYLERNRALDEKAS